MSEFNKRIITSFFLLLVIFFSVSIYYLSHFSSLLGENGKLPLILSIWFSVYFTRKAPRTLVPSQQNFSHILKLVLANRAFVTLVILYGIMTLAIALITAGLPFAAMYLILNDGESLLSGVAKGLGTLSLMFAAFVIGSIISQALWLNCPIYMVKLRRNSLALCAILLY